MMSAANTGDRPSSLPVAAALIVTRDIIAFISFRPAFRGATIASIASCIAVVYFFWRGKNWSRIAVLAISVISLLGLFFDLQQSDPVRTIAGVIHAVISIILLWWLNTSEMKSYFHRASGRGII
jgi:hypothetical protein